MDNIIYDIDQNNQLSEDIKKELHVIYQKYLEIKEHEGDMIELKKRVDYVLESMFKAAFNFNIPMDFINSPLGRKLFEIKLDIGNTIMYGIAELMIISGKSKQLIYHDYQSGYIEGIETGKKKRVLVTEEAVYKYITTIGRNTFTPEVAKKRIQVFNTMNKNGFSDEEIRNELRKIT